MVELKKNLHDEITRLYPVLLTRARGLMRDDDMGHELLHTVLDNCLHSEAVVRTLNELLPRGSVEYYLNRCIYLSAYSKTTKFNKDKVRSVEIDYYREQVLSFDQWQHHEANIGSRLTTEQLDSLISQLPVFDAELVRLWSVDGFSYEDASRISGIPKEVMYQSIRKSIKLLREYVQHKNRSTGSLSGTA